MSQPKCTACLDELDRDHQGIRCSTGHHLCLDRCAKQFVDKVLEEPLLLLPLKCPTCKVALTDDSMMQRVMTPEQLDKYEYHILHIAANENNSTGEIFCVCPFCKYHEYRKAEEGDILFVYCQEPSCNKTSCFVCKLSVDIDNNDELNFHIKCSSMQRLKTEFEKILLSGNTVACPKCKLTGMKDYSCSHICCPNCKTDWCYVCGKSKAQLDSDDSRNNIYRHFDEWETNRNRCPMYLRYVRRNNDEFPDDDVEALQKFHECRAKLLLKEFVEKIGEENFRDLVNHFPSVRNCGFALEDIRSAKGWRIEKKLLPIIEYPRYRTSYYFWLIFVFAVIVQIVYLILESFSESSKRKQYG